LSITLLCHSLLVNCKSSALEPSADTILILSVDVKLLDLHVIPALLVEGQFEGGLIEVGHRGPGLGWEFFSITIAKSYCWPGFLATGPIAKIDSVSDNQ